MRTMELYMEAQESMELENMDNRSNLFKKEGAQHGKPATKNDMSILSITWLDFLW
jgi:hypothetical protein